MPQRPALSPFSRPQTKGRLPQSTKSFACPTIANFAWNDSPNLPYPTWFPEVAEALPPPTTDTMNGEDPPERPEYVTNIINGLERYNPEAVSHLENYLQEQCEQKYCDSNANRTLLKL